MPAAAPPRLVGVTQYDWTTTRGGSGLPHFLFTALERTGALDGVVDVGPTRAQRLAAAAVAVHPDRDRWRWRLWNGPATTRTQTRNAARRLDHLRGTDVVAVQTLGMFRITAIPYALVLDATLTAMAREAPDTIAWGGRAFREMVAAERRTYRGARHLFALSRFVRDSLVADHGIDPARITVTGAGPNLSTLPVLPGAADGVSQAPARAAAVADDPAHPGPAAAPAAAPGPPTILFVGRLFERKGGAQLLRAFAAVRERHPDARLQVVGGHVGAPQPGVEYLGAVEDRDELGRLYAAADVFCLPSLFEPHGLSTLEAMAFGLPCVVADVGGLRDTVLPGETGHLVPPGDVDALRQALADLLDDRPRAAEWGRAGRRRIETELNWDAVARRIVTTLTPAR